MSRYPAIDPESARVSNLLRAVAEKLQVSPVAYGGPSGTGAADYWLWTHQIYVSPALANKLTDYQLGCVLAHELGHANTRSRLVATLLIGLVLRLGLPLLVLGALGKGGLAAGVGAGLLAWVGFGRANLYLRLWEEAPADDFGLKFAGGTGEYLAVLQEVTRLAEGRRGPLFQSRAARLSK